MDGHERPDRRLDRSYSIQFMHDHAWEAVRRECHALLRQAIERICELTGLSPLYPLDSDFYSQMGIAPLPSSDLVILKAVCMMNTNRSAFDPMARLANLSASPCRATILPMIWKDCSRP